MGLQVIHIKNYKCIRDFKMDLKQLNILLGENGSGKTNVLSAILYFYDNMISRKPSLEVFDENNRLNDQVEITLTYDLSKLLIRCRKNRNEGKEKYVTYYNMIDKMARKEGGKISLTLTHVKGGKVTWNHGIEVRKMLYHMYPLYHLDAREIELTDWETLWGDIGDLLKPSLEEREDIEKAIKSSIEEVATPFQRRMDSLNEIFQKLLISPMEFSVREFAANIAKIYYGGKNFSYAEHKLNGFSNGTNSYNYMCLFLLVLSIMGKTKLKEPIMLMDEPEISLHFRMIDELSDVIFNCITDIIVLASTHSPRLVKNVLVKEENNCTMYQVYKRGDYSYLCLLSMFSKEDKREKFFLTEHYVNAFFAKILVLVEGETELELLNNPYLRILFPVLKEAEVIKGMSDKVVYRIVDTTTRHYNVPMIVLLDMDKILEWNFSKNGMGWKKEYQFVSLKENYYYGKKRNNTIPLRKRINAICSKCIFSYRLPFFACEDANYKTLIRLVQEYYSNYSIFPVETTVEGMLINGFSFNIIIEYLKYTNRWKEKEEKAYAKLYKTIDKVNFLRLYFNGKSDLLLKNSNIIKRNTKMYDELKEVLRQPVKKTDWVSEWIRFYFSMQTGISIDKLTEAQFAKYCENVDNKRKLINRFNIHFIELSNFLDAIERLQKKILL